MYWLGKYLGGAVGEMFIGISIPEYTSTIGEERCGAACETNSKHLLKWYEYMERHDMKASPNDQTSHDFCSGVVWKPDKTRQNPVVLWPCSLLIPGFIKLRNGRIQKKVMPTNTIIPVTSQGSVMIKSSHMITTTRQTSPYVTSSPTEINVNPGWINHMF